MPQYLKSEYAEARLCTLAEALDLADVGILLLNRELRTRFINNRLAEMFGLPSALLATAPSFRDILNHAGAQTLYSANASEMPEYLDQLEAEVRAGGIRPTRITLQDGRTLLFSCVACPDGARTLTYTDISEELHQEVMEAVGRANVEFRFQTETLEDQAAYLVSLAEAADETARKVEQARQDLEAKIAEQTLLAGELRRLAMTDGLTGALNRSGFFEMAQNELDRPRQHALAFLMLDIDHFKRVNDQYGHAAGDAVLRHLVAIVRASTRQFDLVGRLGGEEFAVLLPVTSPAEADVVAERLRRCVAEAPAAFTDSPIAVTVSIGLTLRQATDCKVDQLIARADVALYQAKEGGRNRVVKDQLLRGTA